MFLCLSALYTAISLAATRCQANKVYAALAVILLGVGATIYIAKNNPAVAYAAAQRPIHCNCHRGRKKTAGWLRAGPLLARAEDFTPGRFPGLLFHRGGWHPDGLVCAERAFPETHLGWESWIYMLTYFYNLVNFCAGFL